MNENRTWLDHTVYRVYRNEVWYWEAAILLPSSHTPTLLKGEDSWALTMQQVKETYGEDAVRLSEGKFQQELERRRLHTPEMLTLLKNNWTERDLSTWHVYGAFRPMTGISIAGTVFLNGNGAKYDQTEIYTYVTAQEPLDAITKEHYSLVTISHPLHTS